MVNRVKKRGRCAPPAPSPARADFSRNRPLPLWVYSVVLCILHCKQFWIYVVPDKTLATQISTKYLKNWIIIFSLELWYSSTSRNRYRCPIRIFFIFNTDQAQSYSLLTKVSYDDGSVRKHLPGYAAPRAPADKQSPYLLSLWSPNSQLGGKRQDSVTGICSTLVIISEIQM